MKMKKYEIAELSDGEKVVWDTETNEHFNFESAVACLNEQQSTIEAKDKEIAELDQQCADFLGDKIKALEEFEECTDKLKAKILEQQATIDKLEQRDYYNQSERYKILGRAIELTINYIANSDEEHYDIGALITEFEKELLDESY